MHASSEEKDCSLNSNFIRHFKIFIQSMYEGPKHGKCFIAEHAH